jgi:hypothetical protein
MEQPIIAIIMCLVLGVFMLQKEFRRHNRSKLIWRLLASLTAVLCFYWILFPIRYQAENRTKGNELNFLTPGVPPDFRVPSNTTFYTADSSVYKAFKNKAEYIPDLGYFLKAHPEVNKINLYGDGVDEAQLQELKGYAITFKPGTDPEGIISCHWPGTINSTAKLLVQGTYHNPGSKALVLVLKGLGLHLDSVSIAAKTTRQFSFATQPRAVGKVQYQLMALRGKDTLSNEPVPFEVVPAAPVKVLILASYPDFEYKFLKNWLYENQYPLIFRTQISKDKYSTDFLNTEKVSVDRLTGNALKNIDFLIIDEETWKALPAGEKNAIDQEVATGMGMLIRTTEGHKNSLNHLVVHSAPNGKVLIDSRLQGRGQILTSAAPETYTWLMEGRKADYANFWSKVLTQAARKKNNPLNWEIVPEFPKVGQKTRLIVELPVAATIPKVEIDESTFAPRQNLAIPFQWDVFLWPASPGWKNIGTGKEMQSFYVYQKEDWKNIARLQKKKATATFITQSTAVHKSMTREHKENRELSRWWFYSLLLLAMGYLWYESRFTKLRMQDK